MIGITGTMLGLRSSPIVCLLHDQLDGCTVIHDQLGVQMAAGLVSKGSYQPYSHPHSSFPQRKKAFLHNRFCRARDLAGANIS